MNMSPPSSVLKCKPSKKPARSRQQAEHLISQKIKLFKKMAIWIIFIFSCHRSGRLSNVKLKECLLSWFILEFFLKLLILSVNLKTDGRIILRWILERYDGMVWTGLIWLRIGTSGGLL
jgi:hypothetical protein